VTMKMLTTIFLLVILSACGPKTVRNDGGLVIEIANKTESTMDSSIQKTLIYRALSLSSDASISEQSNNLVIEIPGFYDSSFIRSLFLRNGNLGICEAYEADFYIKRFKELNDLLISSGKFPSEVVVSDDLFSTPKRSDLNSLITLNHSYNGQTFGAEIGYVAKNDTAQLMQYIKDNKDFFGKRIKFRWGIGTKINEQILYPLYFLKDKPNSITSEMVKEYYLTRDEHSLAILIGITLEENFKNTLRTMTKNSFKKPLAIMVDEQVYLAPTVQGEIPNGSLVMTGNFSEYEAKLLCSILQSYSNDLPKNISSITVLGK